MTNVRSWNDRLRRELRKQWWQTLTAILALALGAGLWLAFTGGDESVGAQVTCETGKAVAVPADNPGLVADCEALLAARDTLRGRASLNWNANTPMKQWRGVHLRSVPTSAPPRVNTLWIPHAGLNGSIPAELGKLSKLWHLNLQGNALTGSIPAELEEIEGLSWLRLAGNKLSGCVPPALRKVRTHDLATLKLPTCGAKPTTTPTATATAVATATPVTKTTYKLTLTQPENGRLVAVPAGPYAADSNTIAVVTATASDGYELTAWGGDCASTPATDTTCALTMNADRSATATFGKATPPVVSGPLELVVISKGDADALTLEWTGGPSNASRWQYRTRTYANKQAQPWGGWANVPGSSATTRSYRLTGLKAGMPYDVQVRPIVGSRAGAASPFGLGFTRPQGGLPHLYPDHVVEGDGVTKWRMSGNESSFVIPDGMRLRVGRWALNWGYPGVGVRLYDVGSGSILYYNSVDGEGSFVGRELLRPANDALQAETNARDVGALFDQIEASLTKVPLK